MGVSPRTEDEFGFAEISVLSFADLYAGKIMAALDRQHPRDLFDVHQLLENEGFTDDLRVALIIYLISHDRTPHRLIASPCRDIQHDYERNFIGMTENDISMTTLVATHQALTDEVLRNMPEHHKKFLISFYRREPDWTLIESEGAKNLPAVKWREFNLDRAGKETRENIAGELETVLRS
jgi:hypothetical protein